MPPVWEGKCQSCGRKVLSRIGVLPVYCASCFLSPLIEQPQETTLGARHFESVRLFRLDKRNMLLQSLAKSDLWYPNEIKQSACVRGFSPYDDKRHTVPQMECTCGIWSCKSRGALAYAYPQFVSNLHRKARINRVGLRQILFSARIETWGIVIECEKGYRSQYARIIPDTIQAYPRIFAARERKKVQYLRKKYLSN